MNELSPDPDSTGAYQPSLPAASPERFAPGTLLAGRYRIVTALGKGGMGEVYRADDLTLAQAVALKFLPVHIAHDRDRLARFRKEVAAARKVSHPNVCRVYDIAEWRAGDHAAPEFFLTMEFVDGEDLTSVLKRIGRMTEEKGVEIARQLCSALAAVHEQGLLHRDLKPANVMLDGRGKVRLTDFGLAAAAEDLSKSEVRSGTPLYQAPEQLAGKEVTVRSDLYALGLVLYELFTGKRAFADAGRETPPSKPSSHVSNLDPAIERLILRCLEPDPANRPRSAMEILARLPGGDPLAAAVAAGETPSPRVVADAVAEEGGLRPGVAVALLAFVVVAVVVTGWVGTLTDLTARTPMRDAEPALMRFKAREALAALGHDEPPGGTAHRYRVDFDLFQWNIKAPNPTPEVWDGRWTGLEDGRPAALRFFYRTARRPLAPTNYHFARESSGQVDDISPPPLEPGMADVTLDLRGRLLGFHKIADFLAPEPAAATARSPDWRPVFVLAGLDADAFLANPITSRHRPPLASDARFAWEGPYPSPRAERVRVEAASLGGKPVFFKIEFPWQADEKASAFMDYTVGHVNIGVLILIYGVPLIAAGLAFWSWRAGRADLVGGAKLAGVLFVLWVVRWIFSAHHVIDEREQLLLNTGLGLSLYESVLVAVLYLGLEPTVRKRWPWRLVSWNRLLAGRFLDPLLARDLLIGLAAGAGIALLACHINVGPFWAPELIVPQISGDYELNPSRCIIIPLTTGLRGGFIWFFLVFVIHWVCRNPWIGSVVVIIVVQGIFLGAPASKPLLQGVSVFIGVVGLQLIALRFGLVAFAASMLCYGWLLMTGWTLDVGAWFATGPNLGIVLLLTLTAACAYLASRGRESEP